MKVVTTGFVAAFLVGPVVGFAVSGLILIFVGWAVEGVRIRLPRLRVQIRRRGEP